MTTVVCVGVGIYAVHRNRRLPPFARIPPIEHGDRIGGFLRSAPHLNGPRYDRGADILSETGVSEIDGLLFDELDAGERHAFAEPLRDLSGLMVDEKRLSEALS